MQLYDKARLSWDDAFEANGCEVYVRKGVVIGSIQPRPNQPGVVTAAQSRRQLLEVTPQITPKPSLRSTSPNKLLSPPPPHKSGLKSRRSQSSSHKMITATLGGDDVLFDDAITPAKSSHHHQRAVSDVSELNASDFVSPVVKLSGDPTVSASILEGFEPTMGGFHDEIDVHDVGFRSLAKPTPTMKQRPVAGTGGLVSIDEGLFNGLDTYDTDGATGEADVVIPTPIVAPLPLLQQQQQQQQQANNTASLETKAPEPDYDEFDTDTGALSFAA